MATRKQIVAVARTFLRTPWHHQGRAKGAGIDCLGLLACTAAECGLPVIDRSDYGEEPVPAELIAGLATNLERIDVSDAREADVLCFWIAAEDRPQHLALVTDVGMLHAWREGAKVVHEHGITQGWRARIHSAWRYRGLEEES